MIHPQDENELRGLLYLGEQALLPPALEQLYLRVKRIRDRRYGGPMSLDLLTMLVVQAGYLPKLPVKVSPGAPGPGSNDFSFEGAVEAFLADAWHPAKITGKHRYGIRVQIENDTQHFRVLKPENIRALATA